jgi:pimeloyl-ACP methyl ester carboxylesterase
MKIITESKQVFFRLYITLFFIILNLEVEAQTTIPRLPEMSFAEIVSKEKFNGDRWSYMEAGSKKLPTIVALHGLGGSSADWRFQLDGLSDNFHVVAWNAPGYSLSDGFKKEEVGCKDYADALADFIDALKVDKVYVLGNSNGSRVGQCFAMNYPDRVIKLAFVGTSAGTKGLTTEEKDKIIATRTAQIANGGYAFASRRVEALLGPNPTPELIEVVQYGMRTTHRRGFMQGVQLLLSTGYSPEEVGEKVKVPTLLISGSEDRITPMADNASLLHKALKNSRLEIIQGIGHLPHLEAPKRVNSLIQEFFLK